MLYETVRAFITRVCWLHMTASSFTGARGGYIPWQRFLVNNFADFLDVRGKNNLDFVPSLVAFGINNIYYLLAFHRPLFRVSFHLWGLKWGGPGLLEWENEALMVSTWFPVLSILYQMLSFSLFITDEDDCLYESCLNGATCEDLAFEYQCICPPGYEGTNCETGILYKAKKKNCVALGNWP